jgi:hypothetical protein
MKRYESPNAEYIEFYSEDEMTNSDTWDLSQTDPSEPDDPIDTPEDEFGNW